MNFSFSNDWLGWKCYIWICEELTTWSGTVPYVQIDCRHSDLLSVKECQWVFVWLQWRMIWLLSKLKIINFWNSHFSTSTKLTIGLVVIITKILPSSWPRKTKEDSVMDGHGLTDSKRRSVRRRCDGGDRRDTFWKIEQRSDRLKWQDLNISRGQKRTCYSSTPAEKLCLCAG